jgi:glyoxalase-like protein
LLANGGGVAGRRPRLRFDHVQVAVSNLERAAADFASRYGLDALEGGRHPGRGTANMLVPLGDSYVELIAVVDDSQARSFPTSMRVQRALETGRTFATWVVRTDDLESSIAAYSDGEDSPPSVEIAEGRRRRPDGEELAWRSAELVAAGGFSPLPFLIEWHVSGGMFPGVVPEGYVSKATGMKSIVLSDPDPERARASLRRLLADDLDYKVQQGPEGVLEVVLDTPSGPLSLT